MVAFRRYDLKNGRQFIFCREALFTIVSTFGSNASSNIKAEFDPPQSGLP